MYGARTRISAQNAKARLADSYAQLLREIMAPEPTLVGNYSIIRQLGEGSFGKIYLAVHKPTHTRVVLKCAAKTDPQLVREIHHHRLLRHPHIAQFYEYIVTESAVWLVIEYCPRNDLYGYLVKRRRLSPDETRRLFAQICGAVAYTHSRHCAHRDLKLENILLDKHANAKLSDFGFTRELPTPHALLETVCGTTCYMAPEVLERKRYSGEAVDVWALGVICYTLLYGEMPFEEESDIDTRLKVLTEEPPYPTDTEAAEAVGPEVLELLQRMLCKDPRKRPAVVEILRSSWMGAEGAAQLEILATPDRPLFSTRAERRLLRKFHAAQFDTDAMRESVVYVKCDALAGTWALALRREEKLESRRALRTHSVSLSRYSSSGARRDSSVSVLRREESRRNSETKREQLPATVAEEPPPATQPSLVHAATMASQKQPHNHHNDYTDVTTIPESVQESVPESTTKPKKKFVAAVKQAWMKLMVPSTRGKVHSRPSTASSVASSKSSEDSTSKGAEGEEAGNGERSTATKMGPLGPETGDQVNEKKNEEEPHLSPAFSFVPPSTSSSSNPNTTATSNIPTINTTAMFPQGQLFVRPARPISQISQFSAVSTASSQMSDSEMSLLNLPGFNSGAQGTASGASSGASPKRHHSLTGPPASQYLRRPYMGRRSTSSSFSSIHSVTTPRTQPSKHKRTHSKASSVSSLSLKSDASVLHRGNSMSSTTSKKGNGGRSNGPGFSRHHSTPSSSRATSRVASPDSLRSTYSGASSSMASGTSGTPRATPTGRRARSRRGLSRTITPTNGFMLPITRAGSPFVARRGERGGDQRYLGGLDSSLVLGRGVTRQGTPPIGGRVGWPHLGDARMPGPGVDGYNKNSGSSGGGSKSNGARPSQASVILEGEEDDDDDYEEIDDDDELEEEMEDLVGNVGNVGEVGEAEGQGGDFILGL